jgi:hypothetical protein
MRCTRRTAGGVNSPIRSTPWQQGENLMRGLIDRKGEQFAYLQSSTLYDLEGTATGRLQGEYIVDLQGSPVWRVIGHGIYALDGSESIGYIGSSVQENPNW